MKWIDIMHAKEKILLVVFLIISEPDRFFFFWGKYFNWELKNVITV